MKNERKNNFWYICTFFAVDIDADATSDVEKLLIDFIKKKKNKKWQRQSKKEEKRIDLNKKLKGKPGTKNK